MFRALVFLFLVLAATACADPTDDVDEDLPGDIAGGLLLVAGATGNGVAATLDEEDDWRDCVAAITIGDVAPDIAELAFDEAYEPVVLDVDLEHCVNVYGVPPLAELRSPLVAGRIRLAIDNVLGLAGIIERRVDPCAAAWVDSAVVTLHDLAQPLVDALAIQQTSVSTTWPGLADGACTH
jgi:hypothetical protein